MKDAYLFKDIQTPSIQFKDVDGKKGIVTGYFADFDTVDSDGDIIRRGAFERTIRENGPKSSRPRIKHLMNHDTSQPLGLLVELKEDDKGLYYESRLGTHTLGQDFIKMVESGLISEHSIGFRTVKRNQLQDYDSYRTNPAKGWFELIEVKLYEGSSLTAWGANMNTPLTGLKTELQVKNVNNRIDLLCKALRNGTFTDETFDLLEIELQQLKQFHINLLKEAEQSAQATSSASAMEPVETIKAIETFINSLNSTENGHKRIAGET
jgi:HK97 family phage prohead protease